MKISKQVKLSVALGLVLVLLLAGCAKAAPAPTPALVPIPTPKPAPAPVGKAKPTETVGKAKPTGTVVGGIRNLASENFLPDLSVCYETNLQDRVYDATIYVNSRTGKIFPGLAERWEIAPDFSSLTFKVRKGVQFDKGYGEVTAEDIKYTLDRLLGSKSIGFKSPLLRLGIERLEVPDPYTLIIYLKAPDPFFYQIFQAGFIPILSKKYVESVGDDVATTKPIGTGPYRLVKHVRADIVTFEAKDEHWRVVPEFKFFTWLVIQEESTGVAMLKTGQLDFYDVTAQPAIELEKAGFKIWTKAGGGVTMFNFGGMLLPEDPHYVEGYHRNDPWTDVRVREAMTIAIDRGAIVEGIYLGTAKRVDLFPPFPGSEELLRELGPIPYDPARAKKLLAEAGYPNGFPFKMWSYPMSGNPELPKLVEVAASYWQAIGLKPIIIPIDWDAAKVKWFYGQTVAGVVMPFRHGSPDTLNWAYSFRGGSYNAINNRFAGGQYPEMVAVWKKIDREFDQQKLLPLYQEYLRLSRKVWDMVPIALPQTLTAASSKIGVWPREGDIEGLNLNYLRQNPPLNTFRLFDLE